MHNPSINILIIQIRKPDPAFDPAFWGGERNAWKVNIYTLKFALHHPKEILKALADNANTNLNPDLQPLYLLLKARQESEPENFPNFVDSVKRMLLLQ